MFDLVTDATEKGNSRTGRSVVGTGLRVLRTMILSSLALGIRSQLRE